MNSKYLFVLIFALIISWNSNAQTTPNLTFSGNARFSYVDAEDKAAYFTGGSSSLRLRIGGAYRFNEVNSFHVRLATTQNDHGAPVNFTVKPDGGGLHQGSISFDNFYYRYNNVGLDIKIGRFQHVPKLRSNSGRSILRFQSANTSNHWVDGFQIKKNLSANWVGEIVAEYQNRGNTSYPYRSLLDFGKNEHNLAAYFGAQNQNRDNHNFIQKGFGLFIAPDAYLKPDNGYSTYIAVLAQLVHDTPLEILQNGSLRVAAEAGQNMNASEFLDGNILNLSFGVHNFANKHQLMVEFTKTGAEWQTANIYAPNADEMEIRYRYFFTNNFNIDFRYRIRDFRAESMATNYNFFARATYFF